MMLVCWQHKPYQSSPKADLSLILQYRTQRALMELVNIRVGEYPSLPRRHGNLARFGPSAKSAWFLAPRFHSSSVWYNLPTQILRLALGDDCSAVFEGQESEQGQVARAVRAIH